jgi:beta-hydroxyacyl-ACP dehydratase FabZ
MSEPSFGIREIFARLPHRQPLLLVDRVLEVKSGERLVAIKNVTVNEDFFRGHFPGNPIMPGVLIVEALAQAAGLLISASLDRPEPVLPYLVGVDGVKFRRPVVPGDQVSLEVEVKQRRGRYWRFAGRAVVDGEKAAEAEILLAVLSAPATGGDAGKEEAR